MSKFFLIFNFVLMIFTTNNGEQMDLSKKESAFKLDIFFNTQFTDQGTIIYSPDNKSLQYDSNAKIFTYSIYLNYLINDSSKHFEKNKNQNKSIHFEYNQETFDFILNVLEGKNVQCSELAVYRFILQIVFTNHILCFQKVFLDLFRKCSFQKYFWVVFCKYFHM